jgi:hypothetical protein
MPDEIMTGLSFTTQENVEMKAEFYSPREAQQTINLIKRDSLTFQAATNKLGLVHGVDFILSKEGK